MNMRNQRERDRERDHQAVVPNKPQFDLRDAALHDTTSLMVRADQVMA